MTFAGYAVAVLTVVFAWWFSTGAVLYLVGLPQRSYPWSVAGVTLLAAAALLGLWFGRDDDSPLGAYLGFACGLLVWAWHEVVFLMGYVTGPVTAARPPQSRGIDRFLRAFGTVYHHELAILVTGMLVVALSWEAANQIAAYTFLLLWAMRLSAKLNVFLGVPNLTEEFLPDHLAHLHSHFKKAPINPLFPLSVTAATLLVGALAYAAATVADPAAATGLALLATLAALGLLEHWFMVLPLPDASLWRWALRVRGAAETAPHPAPHAAWRSS